MSVLVTVLKGEHELIVKALAEAKELGISSPEARGVLMAARDSLLLHLEKEDRELYPILRKAAETDENLALTLEMFAKDVTEITRFVGEFFNKYDEGGDEIEFAPDFGALCGLLGSRIQKEEMILYAKFDELLDV